LILRRALLSVAGAFAMSAAAWAADSSGPADPAAIEGAIAGGRLVQARAMIARVAPGDPALPLLAAELALAERNDSVALAGFQALSPAAPEDCRINAGLGIAAARLGRDADALAPLEAATRLCPDRWHAWEALGVVHDRAGRFIDAERAYRTALATAGDRAGVLNNLGYSLILQRRSAEAVPLLREAARLAPDNERIANNLDIARAAAGDDLAGDLPGRGSSRWADRLNNAGYAAYLAGNAARAARYLSQAITDADVYPAQAAANLALVEGPK
jgi:Flp pilus assembly protein TadD